MVILRLYGYIWLYRYINPLYSYIVLSGNMENMVIGLYGYMGVWLYSYMNKWLSSYMVIWLSGYMVL